MMSITGPAICAHSADDYEVGQAVSCGCGIDNRTDGQLHRAGEMAQSVARAFMPRCFRWVGGSLFPALGRPKAVRDNSYYWGGPRTGTDCADSRLSRRLRRAFGPGRNATRRAGN